MTEHRVSLEHITTLHDERPASRLGIGALLVVITLLLGIGLAFIGTSISFIVALGILAALVLGVTVVRNPEVGLLLIIFAIPLEDFNQLGQIEWFSPIKIMGIAMIGAYLIHYMVFQRGEKLVYVPQNVFLVLFFIAVMLSDLTAANPAVAIDKTFKILRMISFYFLVINIVRSEASLKRVMWVMILAGILSAGYGMYEYYFHPERLDEMRISGTLDDPMGFAYTMVILLPLIWYMFTHTRRLVLRAGLVAAGLLFLYAILLSGTRSAFLATGIVLLMIALREKRPVLSFSIAAVIVLLAFLLMPEQVRSRLGLSAEPDKAAQASTERRLTYLEFGMQLFLEKPFLGDGLEGFAEKYSQSEYQFLRADNEVNRIAHNMYVEIAIGTGLLGLMPFLMLMLSPLVELQKVQSRARFGTLADLAKMFQVSLAAFLVVGLFASSQYDKPLWLLIGLASILPVIARERERAAVRAGMESAVTL